MKTYILFSLILLTLASCSQNLNDNNIDNDSEKNAIEINYEYLENLNDTRDGNVYKVIKIENQIWMAENLRFDVGEGSYCFDDNPDNCLNGRIYTWDAAMNGDTAEGSQGVCPEGWHMPTNSDWDLLINNIGGDTSGNLLKLGGELGFDAQLNGGRMALQDSFQYMRRGTDVCFWSSESDSSGAYDRNLTENSNIISKRYYPKSYGFCVRCIMDSE